MPEVEIPCNNRRNKPTHRSLIFDLAECAHIVGAVAKYGDSPESRKVIEPIYKRWRRVVPRDVRSASMYRRIVRQAVRDNNFQVIAILLEYGVTIRLEEKE